MIKKYDNLSQTQLSSYINYPPEKQKEVVYACFNAAKNKSTKGRRYTVTWIYECLLMRIKSPKLYRKTRKDNTLPLPSYTTLQRYIKKIHPVYGFSEAAFEVMGLKTKDMSEMERHGCLLLDKMKLSETPSFQRSNLYVEGFVDLGKYSTENDKTKLGDHALLLLYQPFCGKWYQTVGIFLSTGAVSGHILEKIITEAVILLENQNIHVDCITDGRWANLES
ncbi:uncharacterized protein LOC126552296 [Aphis gossypii]|uniref:uncharacterized protein LOC126552296 n=1 Tax=Aphis gossypii TaxID=80765 RepID=UPI00215935A6|nr:uncharacterized protein LOC126552296 [Aphis gossypii]